MTEQQLVRRELSVVVKQVAETTQRGKPVWIVATEPRSGRQYPDNFTCRNEQLAAQIDAGMAVTLVLERENLRGPGKDGKQRDTQWPESYYEAIVGIKDMAKPGSQAPVLPVTAPASVPATSAKPQNGGTDPWDRWLSWGDLTEQARLMVHDIYGDADYSTEDATYTYAERFRYCLGLLVDAVLEQKARYA